MNSIWFDKRFEFYWTNYKKIFTSASNENDNDRYLKHFKEQSNFIYLASLANKAAHLAAKSSIQQQLQQQISSSSTSTTTTKNEKEEENRNNNNKRRTNNQSSADSSINSKSHKKSKRSRKSKLEFEISDDLIRFYEQSILYKREKSKIKLKKNIFLYLKKIN